MIYENSQNKVIYRHDIDGLRAVAVLSVLIFHLNRAWLPGGYIGVDIFFVISGFLITRIISREMTAGHFSFAWFYVKRMRRILPVFYTVTVVTTVGGAVLLLPKDVAQLMTSARYAIFFVANIYFGKNQGYFDISADEKPLLHTWSLAIEEQYYLFWPLLLLAIVAICRWLLRRHSRAVWPTVAGITLLFLIGGYAYAEYMLITHPGDQKYYFQIQTRFSELMTGAFIALLPLWHAPRTLRALSYLGALLFAAGLVLLNEQSRFPGFNALLPCVGAAFIIYAGQSKAVAHGTWLHRMLGLKAMSTVGLWSYSLYLWHWPILAYMRYVWGSYLLPWSWMLVAVILTFGLSWLSYTFIEQRTRHLKPRFHTATAGFLVLPAMLVSGLTWAAGQARPEAVIPADLATYGTDVCHGNFDKECIRGDRRKSPSILVTGDSHAAMLNSFIDVVGVHEGWSANVVTASSCSPVFDYTEQVLPNWAQKPCAELKNYIVNNYRNYDAVFLMSAWSYQLSMGSIPADPNYLVKLKKTLQTISKSTPVYVFSDAPILAIHPFRAAHFHAIGLHVHRKTPVTTTRANAIIKDIVDVIPNVHWINLDPEYQQLDQGVYAGIPAYHDEQHLNIHGARILGKLFNQDGRLARP